MRYSSVTPVLLGSLGLCASAQHIVHNPAAACHKLGASLAIDNVKVNFAEYLPAGMNITSDPGLQPELLWLYKSGYFQ